MSVENNRLGQETSLLAAAPAQSRALAGLVRGTLALAKRRKTRFALGRLRACHCACDGA